MPGRGILVCYESIWRWGTKFGQGYANQLRRPRPRPGDKWHLDEVFVKISGITHYLWRAVDQRGNVLDVLVPSRRNAKAAKWFFGKLFKGLRYVPGVLVTDKLASYRVAHRELMPSLTHRQSKYLNNRAENSHQPTRQCERAMKRFKSPRDANAASLTVRRIPITVDTSTCQLRAATPWPTSPAVTRKKISHFVSADRFFGRRRPLRDSGMNCSPRITQEDSQYWVIFHPDLCGEVRGKPPRYVECVG
jgi:transposase-like protein